MPLFSYESFYSSQTINFSSAISQVETIKLYKLLNTAEKLKYNHRKKSFNGCNYILRHRISIDLRRISCHGRNHSQASCEYSLTIFLCCQHHSEYSLLGSKFSTNLLFAASMCHTSQCNNVAVRVFKMAEPDGIVAVVKHCWLLVQGRRGCRETSLNTTIG